MKTLLTTLAATLAATAATITAAGLLVVPAQAASTVTIRPEALERGPELRGAHLASLDSKTIVDGDVRVTVRGDYVSLLGESAGTYVVMVERDGELSTLRVGPGGSERLVARDTGFDYVRLSSDGGLLVRVRPGSGRSSSVDAIDVTTGRTTATRRFAFEPRILDARGERVLLGDDRAGTVSWDVGTGRATTLTRRWGYEADLAANRLATFDEDPYEGGCSIVTTLTRPQTRLWTSCGEGVRAFSPDGQRVVTDHILSDGPGPNRLRTRSIRGALLASYAVDGRFGGVSFESDRAVLLATYGADKASWVRCTGSTCERASALTTSPEL